MSNAKRDDNRVPTLLALLDTDGSTLIPIQVNASNNKIKLANGTAGVDNGDGRAMHDGNGVVTMIGVSSVDLTTPVNVYADINGNIKINTM